MTSNNSFEAILKAKERKDREAAREAAKKKRREHIDLGDTETGRVVMGGRIREETKPIIQATEAGFRIYKASSGAVKGRGKFGGIRK